MRRLALLLAVAVVASGCSGLFSRIAARRVANDQLSIESFHGRTVEKHVVKGQPGTPLVKDVWYQKLSKTRVEVVAPAELAGQLFIYDGSQVSMWWPSSRFGVRMRGVPAPREEEQWDLVRTQAREAYSQYAYTRLGESSIAGHEVQRWNAEPRDAQPYRYAYDSWMDQRRSIPLRLELRESPGQPWYEMQYDALEYDVEIDAKAFAFEFPKDAMVFDMDFAAAGLSVEEAESRVGFALLKPSRRGIDKVIVDQNVATLVMNEGARWLTITEVKQAVELAPPTGKPVTLGDTTGTLDFLGTYSSVSWSKGGTRLTLISNLPYPEAIAVAASVE